MKSYQYFKIYKRFYKKREKTVDDDYAQGHLSAACFFVPRHKKSLTFSL